MKYSFYLRNAMTGICMEQVVFFFAVSHSERVLLRVRPQVIPAAEEVS